jgi:hypothetical protein
MSRLLPTVRICSGLAIAALLSCGSAQAVEVQLTGYTDGCFGCAPTQSSATQSTTLQGLTFTDSSFDGTTAGGFLAFGGLANNLGTFALSGQAATYAGAFNLLVTFTAPPGTTPNSVTFASSLTGIVTANATGGVFINFDNTPQLFTFGPDPSAGTFSFSVNDLSINPGQALGLSGTIIAEVSAVPEPSTWAMTILGFVGIAAVGRRSRKKRLAVVA